MAPDKPLPFTGHFSAEEYVDNLLNFANTSHMFQLLAGGVHVLDFFTSEPGLFYAAIPDEWQSFLLSTDIMRLLDLLVRDDLDSELDPSQTPPESFLDYIRAVRSHSLGRTFTPKDKDGHERKPAMPTRSVLSGMRAKKIHEVVHFADYVDRLASDVAVDGMGGITHLVDFGSGQNYLGRALVSPPYNRRVVAVEGRENNVAAARVFDVRSGLADLPRVMRNKKLWMKVIERVGEKSKNDPLAVDAAIKDMVGDDVFANFKPREWDAAKYSTDDGKGTVQYVSARLDNGDLADVVAKIDHDKEERLRLMAMSLHSCGNLSHYGIRSLLLNKDVRAVAIVGCCYNLMTEKLGPPPPHKGGFQRPSLQPVNGRVLRESTRCDPEGFPLSERFSTYDGDGIRLNVTARMMACQAVANWTREDSEGFFTRHFFRAVLQRIFFDRGVVSKVQHADAPATPFNTSTNPVVIGSLRKKCYMSFRDYVRGAIEKLTTSGEFKQYADIMREKMGDITDEEIERYEGMFRPRRHELCVVWTLMAFSAMVTESLIVADRWTFLKEHDDVVERAWVEAVFDFKESPRNLVVVGTKKEDA